MRVGLLSSDVFAPSSGGTVTTCLNLARYLESHDHEVIIFTTPRPPGGPMRRLHGLRFVEISMKSWFGDVSLARAKLMEAKLDVAISIWAYNEQLFWAVALMGTGIPWVYCERNSPDRVEMLWNRQGRLAAMSGADVILLQMPMYMESLPPFLRERAVCIPNSAPPVRTDATAQRSQREPLVLCSVGRIAPVKALPLLMAAFARVSPHFPKWELDIWGQDGLEMDLGSFWRDNPARERIHLKGLTSDPLSKMRQAHLFCIQSTHEGMPRTLLEAMSCGLPVVGLGDCPAVSAIIRDGENGLLVPTRSEENLAEALARCMADPALRHRLGEGGLCTAREQSPDAVGSLWEDLLKSVTAKQGITRMKTLAIEPFASRARLSSAARQEDILRRFGDPLCHSLAGKVMQLRDRWKDWRNGCPNSYC